MSAQTLSIFCVLAVILTIANAAFIPLNYKNCKSVFPIKAVRVENGEISDDHAVFKRGSKPVIQIQFEATADTPSLTASVRSKMAGGSAFSNFALAADDACAAGNLTCPLTSGNDYWYSQSVTIADTYPIVNGVQVNWALSSEGKAREVCIIFLANIIE
uniref:ML domain-containing protein n=1 Tax=Panagrellus redivivus TaxID=6233 RepID=A0A7E4ZRM4_PANRE